MNIASVKSALPSRVVSNAEVIDLIRFHSKANIGAELEKVLHDIGYYLRFSGSQNRRWLAQGERPIDLLIEAIDGALAEGGARRQDVDLILYTGIGRGFIEPGNSYHVANALGLTSVECFDIIDACMSWVRALFVAETLLKGGLYRNILVVNAEFNVNAGDAVFPRVFALDSPAAVEWTFPAFTLGEAASATLLRAEGGAPAQFHFRSRPDLADLCNVPLRHHEGYARASPRASMNGAGAFTSFGADLHGEGRTEACAVLRALNLAPDTINTVFTHASSSREWESMARDVGLEGKIVHVYPDTGNLVSASIPTALNAAVANQRLARGDRFVGWVGSAGMSFAAFSAIY
jgi:3-oxoacyl-[acyl-carrier-protein] synthase III